MSRAIVIGCGNTLRRDRGAGVAAAQRLERVCPGSSVFTSSALSRELAETVSGASSALFLVASTRTTRVSVTRLDPDSPAGVNAGGQLSPSEFVAYCADRHGSLPEDALLFEIPAFETGFGQKLSARTLRMIDSCVTLVSELLRGETTPEILLCLTPAPPDD